MNSAASGKYRSARLRRMAKYCVPDERGAVNHSTSWCALVVIYAFAASAQASSERLLATGGVIQVEGSGGGGLNPWALISGLETNSEVGGSADCTYVRPQHFDRLWPDARDVFVAWFPIKYLSLTAAYVDLGNIATHAHQKGWYVALQGSL